MGSTAFYFQPVFSVDRSKCRFAKRYREIKPSIAAIGTYKKTNSPPFSFLGTGFVVGTGNEAITNAHVPPDAAQTDGTELSVLIHGSQGGVTIPRAQIVRKDPGHNLAIIRIDRPPISALLIGDSATVREGQ